MPEKDFMKIYRFIRMVGLFNSVADFHETAAMKVILGIWDLSESEKWRVQIKTPP